MPQSKLDKLLQDFKPGEQKTSPSPSPTPSRQTGNLDKLLQGYDPSAAPTPAPQTQAQPITEQILGTLGEAAKTSISAVGSVTPDFVKRAGGYTLSALSPVIDYTIARPSYAVNKFFDALPKDSFKALLLGSQGLAASQYREGAATIAALPSAAKQGFIEFFTRKDKLSFSQVLKTKLPEFAAVNPKATAVIGFIGDVTFDPTTYLGVGLAKSGVQIAGKTLVKYGESALKAGIRSVEAGGVGIRKNLTNLVSDTEELAALGFSEEVASGLANKVDPSILNQIGRLKSELGKKGKDIEAIIPASAEKLNLLSEEVLTVLPFLSTKTDAKLLPALVRRNAERRKVIEQLEETIQKGNEKYASIVPLINKLNDVGYFPAVSRRSEEIARYADDIGLKPDADIIKGIAEDETFADVQRALTGKTGPKLDASEVRERAEQRLLKLVNSTRPDINLFERSGFRIKMGIPFGKQFDVVAPEIFDKLGMTQVRNAVQNVSKLRKALVEDNIPLISKTAQFLGDVGEVGRLTKLALKGVFKRPDDPLFKPLVTNLENLLDYLPNAVTRTTVKLFSAVKGQEDRRLAIGKFFADVDDNSRKLELQNGQLAKIAEDKILAAGLSPADLGEITRKTITEREVGVVMTLAQGGLKLDEIIDFANLVRTRKTVTPAQADYVIKLEQMGMNIDEVAEIFGSVQRGNNISPGRGVLIANMIQKGIQPGEIVQYMKQIEKGATITQGEADDIFRNAFKEANFSGEEQAVVAALRNDFSLLAEAEMEAGLLKSAILNYFPRVYKTIPDKAEAAATGFGGYTLSSKLKSSLSRELETREAARAAGYIEELDAAKIYAARVLDSRRKVGVQQFKDAAADAFGLEKFDLEALDKIRPDIVRDLRLFGDLIVPTNTNDYVRNVLKVYDKGLGLFRQAATILQPAFGVKQAIANSLQGILEVGYKGFKAFNPVVMIDTGMILMRPLVKTQILPDFLRNAFEKNLSRSDAILASRAAMAQLTGQENLLDLVSQTYRRTAMGEMISGRQLVEEYREYGIVRGFDVNGDRFASDLAKEIASFPKSNGQVAKEMGKFWKWAGMAEDYSRAIVFTQARMMGMSPQAGKNIVDKSLFDYSHGLTKSERDVFRKILPFYTYQRFAIPFALKKFAEVPGTIVTADKFIDLMERLLVDDAPEITEAERDVFNTPGANVLLEQSRLLRGMDPTGKLKFNVFSGMNPFDAINLIAFNEDGSVNLQRTVEKSFFAAVTPYLKVPVETALNRNLFGGRPIRDAEKASGAKILPFGTRITDFPESFQGNAALAAAVFETTLPQTIKDVIGWETRVNPKTGKPETFVNPYLAHTASNFVPGIRSYLNLGDPQKPALDRTIDFFTGIKFAKLDLLEQQQWQMLGTNKEIERLRSVMNSGAYRNSPSELDKAERDLRELQMRMEAREAAQGGIRGQGIVRLEEGETPPGEETEQRFVR